MTSPEPTSEGRAVFDGIGEIVSEPPFAGEVIVPGSGLRRLHDAIALAVDKLLIGVDLQVPRQAKGLVGAVAEEAGSASGGRWRR